MNGYFAEKKMINGEIIEDIELQKTINPTNEIIEGNINGKPIKIIKKLQSKIPKQKSKAKSKAKKIQKTLKKQKKKSIKNKNKK